MTTQYTGPERRHRMSRAWSDWSDRDVHFGNRAARETARHVRMLEKMYKRAKGDKSAALWSGMWELQQRLTEWRKEIARDCASWFDGSAFK